MILRTSKKWSCLIKPTLTNTGYARRLYSSSTVNPDEIAHFSRLSSRWWDESGEFSLLHKMNPIRLQFIRNTILATRGDCYEVDDSLLIGERVLKGLDVLDIGCGGGLLSESLTRLGGSTLGIDASESNVFIASLHAASDPQFGVSLQYRHAAAEELVAESKRFDIVCAMEVVEHVDNPVSFLESCAELVKPGGHLFLSTIARTPLSYSLTILMAEYMLHLVTPGTHTYSKYINASELLDFFRSHVGWFTKLQGGLPVWQEGEVRGVAYLPWAGRWQLLTRNDTRCLSCNYLFYARKPQ